MYKCVYLTVFCYTHFYHNIHLKKQVKFGLTKRLVPDMTQVATMCYLPWWCLRVLSCHEDFSSRMCLKTQMCWFCWRVWWGDDPNQKETMHTHSGNGFQLDQRNVQCVWGLFIEICSSLFMTHWGSNTLKSKSRLLNPSNELIKMLWFFFSPLKAHIS